jgi:hypothetical protein
VGGLDFEGVTVEEVSHFVGNEGAKFELCAHGDQCGKMENELDAGVE